MLVGLNVKRLKNGNCIFEKKIHTKNFFKEFKKKKFEIKILKKVNRKEVAALLQGSIMLSESLDKTLKRTSVCLHHSANGSQSTFFSSDFIFYRYDNIDSVNPKRKSDYERRLKKTCEKYKMCVKTV
ncbi:hypothetical protein RFI_00154 [Reticulomyxa filosa]|uniref:Uncharacterized protein n=1 Tax=Reticulomyxa filosa TaxID=46433 RepID=X6PFW6_RETFI|nr:hypothetical protein RFI_00154 [Reticulomyxa filosa]|eukprot:ETO36909.1 hypothetical protein RFI_00154 [Reticulomyxa filosa]